MALQGTLVREEGDRIYLVAPVAPAAPSAAQIEEFAFGRNIVDDLRRQAPNENIAWYGGHYVEADLPNRNGAMWTSDEIAIKALTPMLMPVTVMHDPRTSVGLIADARLRTPDQDQSPRAKIETALALWKHRYPDVVEEAEHNYREGSLMQSMECLAPNYDCSVCGMNFAKLPGGAEQENWCEHLRGDGDQEAATAVRILRSVTFTGTGLIFGTRGAQGADPAAQLEEVAEFHQRVHQETARATSPRRQVQMGQIQVEQSEWDRLKQERDEASRQRDEAHEAAQKARTDLEAAEAAKTTAESERATLQQQLDEHTEQARKTTLRDERLNALGAGFMAKLGDKTKQHLREDAETLDEEKWGARIEDLEELAGVKRDAAAEGEGGGQPNGGQPSEFSREEVASSKVGGAAGSAGQSNGQGPSAAERRSVVAGLTKIGK